MTKSDSDPSPPPQGPPPNIIALWNHLSLLETDIGYITGIFDYGVSPTLHAIFSHSSPIKEAVGEIPTSSPQLTPSERASELRRPSLEHPQHRPRAPGYLLRPPSHHRRLPSGIAAFPAPQVLLGDQSHLVGGALSPACGDYCRAWEGREADGCARGPPSREVGVEQSHLPSHLRR
jgi:hypothetical protein